MANAKASAGGSRAALQVAVVNVLGKKIRMARTYEALHYLTQVTENDLRAREAIKLMTDDVKKAAAERDRACTLLEGTKRALLLSDPSEETRTFLDAMEATEEFDLRNAADVFEAYQRRKGR